MAVPGGIGKGKIKERGETFGDVYPPLVERRKRADRAAELQHQRLAPQSSQPLARTRQCRCVAGELEAEWHRQSMLHPGPPDGRGATVAPGKRGKCVDGAIEVKEQGIDGGIEVEHERG